MPYRRLPSLSGLRAFESLARNGSIKAAAEELSVTPGAVSQLVKKLETELGCELTVRRSRRLELTRAGRRLQTGLADAFMRLRESVEAVTPVQENSTLIVACGPPFAAKWLVPRLGQFLALHPGADIRVTSGFTLLDYRASEIDIGIRLSNDDDTQLARTWLGEETMMVLASPALIERESIREPRDILRVPLLKEDTRAHFRNAPGWDDWLVAAGLSGEPTPPGIDFGEYVDQALDAAVAGAGVVLGRKVLAARDIEEGRLVCPFGPELSTGLRWQIVCRKEIRHTPMAVAFQDWVARELQQSIQLDCVSASTV